jgi:hypothetical protein
MVSVKKLPRKIIFPYRIPPVAVGYKWKITGKKAGN